MKGKTVILGVTGSIAAHRAVDLASLLVKAGCSVHVVMTADAHKFVTPLPFKTLSRNAVVTDLYDVNEGWKPAHIELADTANLFLIAPATANILAKLAHGVADDALSCIALALNQDAVTLIALGDERQNVAALRDPGECRSFEKARRGIYRAGKGPAFVRLRGNRTIVAGGRNCAAGHRIAPVNDDPKHNSEEVNTLQKLTRLLAAPVVEPSQRAARILSVERVFVLPLRVLIIAFLGYYF